MFSQGEKVVYPGHGVARVCRVVEKNVGGQVSGFFELRFLNKDMGYMLQLREKWNNPKMAFEINIMIQGLQAYVRHLSESIENNRRWIREREKQLRDNIELRNEGGDKSEERAGGGALQQYAVSRQSH